MAKLRNLHGKSESRRHSKVVGHKLSSQYLKSSGRKKQSKTLEKKEWADVTCSVCMEYPHRAVLLLCSSHEKGCRPYMCSTSHRYSNCLEQYKKAYSKVTAGSTVKNMEESELLCPLCRGQVKGWTVVEPARKYFNRKKRACTQENCSFVGTYRKLRKHVRVDHPWSRPREVDPSSAEKWKKLEYERDLEDVISTIRSSMPGAIVMGDYVIDGNYDDEEDEDDDDDDDEGDEDDEEDDEDDDDDDDMEAYIDDAVFRHNYAISRHFFRRGYLWDDGHIINGGGGAAARGSGVGGGGGGDDGYLPRFNRYRSRFLAGRPRPRPRPARRLDEVRSSGSASNNYRRAG